MADPDLNARTLTATGTLARAALAALRAKHDPDDLGFGLAPSVEGAAAAAICGHPAVKGLSTEELDRFHGFVQEQLAAVAADARTGEQGIPPSIRRGEWPPRKEVSECST